MQVPQDRRTYTVQYYKDGKKVSLRRTPPPRLHDAEVGDKVTLLRKRNADWDEGDAAKVKSINPRQPNTLAVEHEDGTQYTFISALEVRREPRKGGFDVVSSDEAAQEADPLGAKYLMWP